MQDTGSLADWVAGLGSLAAAIVALSGFWVVARQRKTDRRDAERGVAFELVAVLMDIANNILVIEKHVRGQRNDIEVSANGKTSARFRVLNPLIGLSSEGAAQLPQGTTSLLIKAGATELWNDALLLANHNRALTSIMKEYRDLWSATISRMPPPKAFTGQVGHIEADADDLNALRPELIKIDSIVGSLEPHVAEAVELTKSVTSRIGPTLRKYFGEPFPHLGDGASPSASSPSAVSPPVP